MATDGQNDAPTTGPVEEVKKTEPVETATHEAQPPTETVHHVSRTEFDALKNAIDGLTQTVAELAPKEPHQDSAPGGVPWTHKFGRH
jgi:hypothetical protein